MIAILKLIIVKYFSSSIYEHLNHEHLKVVQQTIKAASINFNPQKVTCRIFRKCCHYVKINSKYQCWVICNHTCTKQPLRALYAPLKSTPNPSIKSVCKDAGKLLVFIQLFTVLFTIQNTLLPIFLYTIFATLSCIETGCFQKYFVLKQTNVAIYSKISLIRYRLFGRAYRNTNGIVISRVTCRVNKQEKEELHT